jgi:hypothetical protein
MRGDMEAEAACGMRTRGKDKMRSIYSTLGRLPFKVFFHRILCFGSAAAMPDRGKGSPYSLLRICLTVVGLLLLYFLFIVGYLEGSNRMVQH